MALRPAKQGSVPSAVPARGWLFAALLTFLLFGSWRFWSTALPAGAVLRISFLDVGQGDAILVQTPGGRSILVDAGPASGATSQGMRTVVPSLRAAGVQRLDALVLTHPDEDHIGGAPDVLDRVEVRRLLTNGQSASNDTMRETLRTAERRGVEVLPMSRGQRIDCRDGVVAEVLSPPERVSGGLGDNDRSVVLRFRYGRTNFLLTGDAEAEAEREILAAGRPPRADLLKLGHHGSRTSTTPGFLRAVNPQAAVVSCGSANPFGHPHPEVTARLEDAGVPLFRTDRGGGVIAESDGETIRIRTIVRQ